MKMFEALQILLTHAEPTLTFQEAYTFLVDKKLDPSEIKYFQKSFPDISFPSSILSEEKLNQLLALIQQRFNDVGQAENVTFILGNTGNGKSTIINYLCDVPLMRVEDAMRGAAFVDAKPDSDIKPLAKIGHSAETETLFPTITKNKGFCFIECPHILRDHEQHEFSSFAMDMFIQRAKNISSAILLIDSDSISSPRPITDEKICQLFITLKESYARIHSGHRYRPNELPVFFVASRPPEPRSPKHFDIGLVQKHIKNRVAEKARHREQPIDEVKALLKEYAFQLDILANIFRELADCDFSAKKLEHLKFTFSFMKKLNVSQQTKDFFEYNHSVIQRLHQHENDPAFIFKTIDSLRATEHSIKTNMAALEKKLKYKILFSALAKEEVIYVLRGFEGKAGDTPDNKAALIKALHAVSSTHDLNAAASSSSSIGKGYKGIFSSSIPLLSGSIQPNANQGDASKQSNPSTAPDMAASAITRTPY
jgi:hypothetical protein